MLKLRYISLLAAILALPLLTRAEDAVISDTLEVTMDSVVVAEDSVPNWYVAPEIPEALRSPMRVTASACLTDSILTFNIDSVLTEATTYDYDAAGRTIRTTVWQYNADGSRVGKSKQEYAFDASGTQIYTGTFAWDVATNDWRGTAKSEFVYNEAHKMESNITYTWVNNTWLPSQALTYAYDAAGRETEFTTYARNASLNRLVPSKCRLQTWYNASKKYQEINYTAYANGAWSAGTRKDYDYDANGNQIEYTYYSSLSSGNWIPSTRECTTYTAANKKVYYAKLTWSNGAWANSLKEVWEFNSANKQTLHEKYSGSGTNWTITLREISGYDAAGNNTLVENYQLKSNVWTGTKKEEYTFNSGKKKILTIVYKWSNNDWVYHTKTEADYSGNNQTLDAKYSWSNNAWVGTGTRTETIYASGKKSIVYTLNWDTSIADWAYTTRRSYLYSGSGKTIGDTTKHYINSQWVNYALVTHAYDNKGNDTLAITANWDGFNWVASSMNIGTYTYTNSGKPLLVETYTVTGTNKKGNQKYEYAYDEAERQTNYMQYEWKNNTWVYKSRTNQTYDAVGNKTLMESYSWSDNSWIGSSKYEYSYDSSGRQIMQAQYMWSANTWRGFSRSDKIYDAEGNLITSISYGWNNNDWVGSTREDCVFDSSKRIIEYVLKVWQNGGWVNNRRTTSGFDFRGQTISSHQYWWVNSQWVISSLNDKSYDVSDNKIRTETIGSWDNGVVQTFTDKHYFYSCDAPADNNGAQPRTPTELEEIDENNGTYENNVQPFDPTQPAYNLQGQSVDPATYHGIVIQNGKKYVL